MSIDNSECVKSKYFTGQADMDESLSDFQEVKQSCKGPKPAQKPTKPKTRKVTKRIKGQKDIRTALKGNNELVSYSEDFDTVCKKSGLDVDSEELQLAIALSKSLETKSTSNPESSQTLSSHQRVANIRKTLQEYGFKVPEAKITQNKRAKKHRKHYKLLTTTEEEKHENITGKYTQILVQNLVSPRLDQNNSNIQDSDARVFFIATNIPYEFMKDNRIFYADNLIEKSTTTGSLLRDWSEIPGRPESPKLFDTNTMNFKDIDCSQDELDIILSGSIKSVKNIFATKQIEHNRKYRECDIPKIVIDDDEEKIVSEGGVTGIHNNTINIDDNLNQTGVTEIKSPFQKAFGVNSPVKKVLQMKSPVSEIFEVQLPVRELFDVKLPVNVVFEVKSPSKEVMVNSKPIEEVIVVETSNKLTFTHTQQYRSCSPDIFDDELSSIMDNTKPINVLSQEYKTKVFTEDNFMELTQCAHVLSQNSQKSTQLSQNVTKRKSNDFMEITECIIGSSQPILEKFKEVDLTQSPETKDAMIEENLSINVDNNVENVSLNLLSSNYLEQNPNDRISQNNTDVQNVTVLHPDNKGSDETVKDNIDLTQSSNEEERRITIVEENNLTPDKRQLQSMDLTQSSNSDNIDDLPLVDVANSQTQNSLDDTIIINEEEYIANGKVKKSLIFDNEVHSQVFDLTQARDDSIEYNSSPIKKKSTEPCSNSFYENFIHDHSENTESSKENVQNVSNEHDNSSHATKSKESDDIDLTQGFDTSAERVVSPRPVLENIPNNSSLGKKDDVSIDYDEILIDDNRETEKESIKETENDNSLNLKYDSSKSEVYGDVEIVDANNECDMNSSQNSEVFNISDKELDYSLRKSRHEFPRDNFDFGGISILDNVTKLGSLRKSLSEGCISIVAANKNVTMGDSFLPEVNIKKTDDKIIDTAQTFRKEPQVSSPMKDDDLFNGNNGIINVKTPKNSEYILKTDDVTPMADYASMSTPQRNRELDRYGLKPFKRKRAIQILTHLYNQMHPSIQELVDDDQPSSSKKPRHETRTQVSSPKKLMTSPRTSPLKKSSQYTLDPWPLLKSPTKKVTQEKRPQASPKKVMKSPRKTVRLERDRANMGGLSLIETERDRYKMCAPPRRNSDELERDRLMSASSSKTDEMQGIKDLVGYEVTSEVAVVGRVDCHPDDWVFQKREKAKVHSCRVPLHIAFHNYVLSCRSLREAILKYEPVNIDVIHKDLVGYGHRYDPKDLLKFLDKKCITVKTTENNSRNNKR